MFKNRLYKLAKVLAILSILSILTCCGGSGGGPAATPTQTESASLITSMGCCFYNTALDYNNNGSTCTLNVILYYSKSIAADNIENFNVTAPNGSQWTIPLSDSQKGANSSGKPYIARSLVYGDNPQTFPLAGIWTAEINLKDGTTHSIKRTLHEPGSAKDATHKYLYTKEDWTPPTNPTQYIAALGRFPAQGYTVHYSSDYGGRITTTGLSGVRSSFLEAEPSAYNLFCWLYDASHAYLGYTNWEYSVLDHSSTNLISADGELSIVPASTTSSTGHVDLSKVKYIRVVYTDGAQYEPSSYSGMDYNSVSSLIAVN